MKLCMGCMNELEDHLSTCPYCGFNETTLRQESYYLDPGTIIGGKYIVGRVLSYGGHTVSYMGMDAEKNRKVIVKEYLPSDFSTRSEGEKEVTIYSGDGQQQFEQGLTNFLNEANRIQHLRNINGIAKVYDCISENETGYVISEYVEGHTLKEILENGKRYSAEEAANFIRKILQGLVEVHRMDIVHCDISPETIMVTNSGDIKLTDFGATRYVTTANSKSLSIILKRGFAPEEQYRSKGVRGPWTDVYALGAVMYYMITGTVPQESVERALSDDLKEPSKLGISIPKNIENALMNALNVYQKDRTPSAEAFLAELNSREVKRIKVKQQKNKTGKIPVWAKALVAGLACVVVAGGVYIVRNTRNSSTAIATHAITMVDLTGQTKEEVQDSIEALKKQGLEVELKTEDAGTVFDLDKPDGTVAWQSLKAGETLYDPQQKESGTEENQTEKAQDSIVIQIKWNSQSELSYDDLAKMGNAYAMAKALDISTDNKDQFVPVKGDEEDYYDLVSVQISGKTITKKELQNPDNENEKLDYKKSDIKIEYYETNFFYWDKLPDFVKKKNVNNLSKYWTYRYENETKRQKVKKKKLRDSMIEKKYYSIQGVHEEGDIIEQTVSPGTEYDETKPGDTPLKLEVVKEIIEYQGSTASTVFNLLKSKGFGYIKCKCKSSSDYLQENQIKNQTVIGLKVFKSDTEEEQKVFEYQDGDGMSESAHIGFLIIIEDPLPPSTSNTSGNDNSGSYSAPSSGYDSSGSYSAPSSGYNNNSAERNAEGTFDGDEN